MKKHLLTKMLLVAAMLGLGTSAWAGDEWSIDFAALGPNYNDKTGVTISSKVATIGGTDMGTCTVNGDALNSNFVLQTGTTWLMRKANGLYQSNGGGRAMGMLGCTAGQLITIVGTGNPNPSTNATLKSQDGNTYVYTVTADGDVKFTPARYLYFTSISVADPSASAVSYTVKYVDEDGTELKDATTGDGEVGASITLTDSEKASFLNDGGTKKYIYESDDSGSKTIEGDGSTIVTITFREAATYSYTLNSSLDTKIADGSAFEGDIVYVGYPRYILQGITLYEAGVTKDEYRKPITLDADNKVETVTYTASLNNIFFYSEGETLSGITETTYGNIPVRASNALAVTTDADIIITTLPAGKYKFHVGAFTSKSSGYDGLAVKIGVGAEVFEANVTDGNLNVITSDVYTVAEGTEIKYLAEGSNNNCALDYIIIEKTAVAGTIAASGYSSLASAFALDFANAEGIGAAYVVSSASESEKKAYLTAVTEVPGNEGVILKGTGGANYSIPVLTSATPVEKNLLKGAVEAFNCGANEVYILQDGQFHLVTAESTVPAGKAYLPASNLGAAPALSLVFEDNSESTGISEMRNAQSAMSNEIYNLNGQRVAQPTKGLYITNGRKVVVK